TLVVRVEQLFFQAALVDRLLHLGGEPRAIRALVVHDRDVFALEMLDQIIADEGALLIVTAADAERVPETTIGERRIGRAGRDLQHTALGVRFRSRDRG